MDLNELVNRVFALELAVKKMDYRERTVLADAAATLDADALVNGGLFAINASAARILTTPTAVQIRAVMVPKPVIGDSFIVYIDNAGAFNVTLTAGGGISVGDGIVNDSMGAWMFIMDSATTFKAWRISN